MNFRRFFATLVNSQVKIYGSSSVKPVKIGMSEIDYLTEMSRKHIVNYFEFPITKPLLRKESSNPLLMSEAEYLDFMSSKHAKAN